MSNLISNTLTCVGQKINLDDLMKEWDRQKGVREYARYDLYTKTFKDITEDRYRAKSKIIRLK